MTPEEKIKAEIPDLTAETLIPPKGVKLSAFARVVWGMVIAIGIGVICLGFSRFDFDRLRGADHYVGKARAAVDAQDWTTALGAIQKVPGEVRGKPEFNRLLADYMIGTRSDPGFLAQTLEKLRSTAYVRPEDAIWLVQAYLATGKTTSARQQADRWTTEVKMSLKGMDTEVALLRAEGRAREAAELENQLFNQYPEDPGIAVRKASSELTGSLSEIRQAAAERLWVLAERRDEHGLNAIRMLARSRALTPRQAKQLQTLVERHPNSTNADRLTAASALLASDAEHRKEILNAEVERMKQTGTVTMTEMVAWLAKEQAFDAILQLVPREALMSSKELFPALAQDLAQKAKWEELMTLVAKGKKIPVSNARAASWRALACRNLHPEEPQIARAHLEEAFAEGLAKNDSMALTAALTLAEEWHMLDLALETLLKLAVPGDARENTFLSMSWDLATKLKDEDVLLKIAARQHELNPENPVLARRYEYLCLLRGEEMEVVGLDGRASPPSPASTNSSLLVAALRAYRLGDLKQSASDLAKIQPESEMSPGESAVFAGLLTRIQGATSQAYQLAEKIHPELLLAGERSFWAMAR